MNIRELPREMWSAFFNDFSRHYRGKSVTVRMLGRSGTLRGGILARRLPLTGITAETGRDGVCSLQIIVGNPPDDHLMHVVHAPSRVRIGQTTNGADEVLFIESDADPTVRVDFGPVGTDTPPAVDVIERPA